MDIEGILAIVLIFGGGALFLLAVSPVGRAIAKRIQGDAGPPKESVLRIEEAQQAVFDEIEGLRHDLTEVQERLDFAERMLAQQRATEPPKELGGGAA